MKRWPRLRSFRLRITLMSTGVALLALVIMFIISSYAVFARRAAISDGILASQLVGPVLLDSSPSLWPLVERQLDASFRGFIHDQSTDARAVLLVREGAGRELFRSRAWPAGLDPARAPVNRSSNRLGVPGGEDIVLATLEVDGHQWRVGSIDNGQRRITMAVNASLAVAQAKYTLERYAAMIPLTLLCMGVLAWYLSGRAIRSIEHVSNVMLKVNASDLKQRVSAAEEDREFAQLVTVFNQMLDRLDRSFLQAARFSGDAAHELKTPLTILQGEMEQLFTRAANDSPLQQDVGRMIDEVRRLDSIVKKLLLLSRADAGQLHLPKQAFDLRARLDEVIEDVGMMAPGLTLRLSLPERMEVAGDSDLLLQVIHNLVSNALKYGLANGWLSLSAARVGDLWQIDVANASAGIGAAHRERLFDRFYRADQTHNRRVAGVGLGLSLAREIALAHGGQLALVEAGPPSVCFRLSLPARP